MAFKTNSIRLKEYSDSGGDPGSYDGTAANGDIAIVGTTLKLRAGGAWTSIAGAGGATELNGLTDVGESPASSSINEVAVIVNDSGKKMKFQKLTLDNIDASTILDNSELATAATNNTVYTSSAVATLLDNRGTGTSYNHVQNTNLTGHLALVTGSKYNNLTYVNTGTQTTSLNTWQFQFSHPELYADNAIVTVYNASPAKLTLGKVGSGTAFNFNCPQLFGSLQTTIVLETNQKAILVKTGTGTNNVWDTIVASI